MQFTHKNNNMLTPDTQRPIRIHRDLTTTDNSNTVATTITRFELLTELSLILNSI